MPYLAACLPALAGAQIRTDGSVGPAAQTLAGPNVLIPQNLGHLAGSNLFHSFAEFNIGSGESATFSTSSAGIANVISRVTGGNLSQINGKLALSAASGNPNLFLINPAGVVFGAGATIDVPGAFHVTTANYLRFADGDFHVDPRRTSTYSTAAPQAFGFLGSMRSAVVVKDGGMLFANPGQSIGVVAGDVGVINDGIVAAENGGIRIVAVGGKALVAGISEESPPAGGNIDVVNGGYVFTFTRGRSDAGRVAIAAENLSIDNRGNPDNVTAVVSQAWSGSTGNSGEVDISVNGRLTLADGGRIGSNTYSAGNAGNVKVAAGEVSIDGKGRGNTLISSDARPGSSGDAGSVEVTAGVLAILDYGWVLSETYGSGNAGAVRLAARTLTIDGGGRGGSTGVSTSAAKGSQGDAGEVSVVADTLAVVNSGIIQSMTFSTGNAGAVRIHGGAVNIDSRGSARFTGVSSGSNNQGNAGRVEVVANTLAIVDGGKISSAAVSSGNAGAISIDAAAITIDGRGNSGFTGVASSTLVAGPARAGDVGVTAETLAVVRGGNISSSTRSAGNAGNIEITTRDSLVVAEGGFINSATSSSGNAGTIRVGSPTVTIDGRGTGRVTGIWNDAFSGSAGNAGSIEVTAKQRLSLLGGGWLTSSTDGSGVAGAIVVDAGTLIVDGGNGGDPGNTTRGSGILAAATNRSSGQTGNVTVTARDGVILANGGLLSIENAATAADPGRLVPTRLAVSAPSIELRANGMVSAASTGNVAAGGIDLRFADRLGLDSASLSTRANQGNGGAIAIRGPGVMALERSKVTTSVGGQSGNGGRINIQTGGLAMNTGFIQANTAAANGSGGDVAIDVRLLVPSGNTLFVGGSTPYEFRPEVFGFNVIQAAAPTGVSGSVQITTPAIDVSGSLGALKAQAIDAGGLGRSRCGASGGSSLALMGRGGLPPAAGEALSVEAPPTRSTAVPMPAPEPLLLTRAESGCVR